MQLFDLFEKCGGKVRLLMTDSLPKVNQRLETLRASYRGGKRAGRRIELYVKEAEATEKYRKAPHNPKLGGGDAISPPTIRKN